MKRPQQGRSGDRRRTAANRARTRVDAAKRQGAYDRLSLGGELVIGRHAVLELLKAKTRRVRDVWISDEVGESAILQEIQERAEENGVPVRHVNNVRLDAEARADVPQGVLAHAVPLADRDIDEICADERDHPAFFLVLDGIGDPHNLGALLRSANATNVDAVVIGRHRAAHVTPAVTKAAAGAIEHMDFSMVAGIPSALERLKKNGVWTVGLDSDSKDSLFSLSLADQPIAVVMGSEGTGLSALTRKRCDAVVSIPQFGAIESLNVSVAGALAMYEIARKRSGV